MSKKSYELYFGSRYSDADSVSLTVRIDTVKLFRLHEIIIIFLIVDREHS